MTTTLPTPDTLRSRAAVALACAESATDTGRFTTDAARTCFRLITSARDVFTSGLTTFSLR